MHFMTLTADQFSAHLATTKRASFQQSLEMAELLSKRGYGVTFVGWGEADQLSVSALLYSRSTPLGPVLTITAGPIWTNPDHLHDFYQGLKAYAKAQKALELIVKPYDTYQTFDSHGQPLNDERVEAIQQLTALGFRHQGLTTGYPGGEPTWHYIKGLSGLTPQNLPQSFSKKGKALLNKMHSFGISLRQLSRDDLSTFKAITSATSERRSYTDKSLDYYQDFYDAFGDKAEFMVAEIHFETYKANLLNHQAKLQETIDRIKADLDRLPQSHKKQNQLREYGSQYDTFTKRLAEAQTWLDQYGTEPLILAGSLFVYTPQEAVYLFSGSYPEFNTFYAPLALQEHVMQEAIRREIDTYNLLGIQGIFDGTDGVLGFKQNFNGHIERQMGTFTYQPFPLKYQLIQWLKKILRR